MLRRPRAVRIVWVCNPASGGAQRPSYRLLHWRPQNIHGVGFAESNSYDIHGLPAIIWENCATQRNSLHTWRNW